MTLRRLLRYGLDTLQFEDDKFRPELEAKTVQTAKNSAYRRGLIKWREQAEVDIGVEETNKIFDDEFRSLTK